MLNPDSEDAPNLSVSNDRNASWLPASQEMPYPVHLQSQHTSNSPEEIGPTEQNQFPQRPLCRNGSSLSSGEEDEHTSNSLERPPRPLCQDGSSLSSYEADETVSAQDSTVATLDSYAPTYDDTSSSSESEHGNNVLARLPEQLAVQSPQVLVENSTDVHVGPHFQYNGPITVKQYISLDGKKAIENDSTTSPLPAQMPHLKGIANVLLKPGGKQGIDNDAFDPGSPHLNNGISAINISEDPLYNSKGDIVQRITFFLKKHYIYISLFVITVTVICIILGVTLAPSYKDMNSISKDIKIFCEKKDIVASVGDKQVKWVVDVDSLIGELQVTWYDPNCRRIEQTTKYEFQTIPKPDGNFQAVLTLFDLDKNDQGLYKLHVYNNNGEDWEYFTLKVNGNGPVDRIVACYVCEWASLRTGLGKFTVDDVDPTQCTHLLYAFANFNEDTNSIESKNPSYDLGEDNQPGAYKKMTSFKQKYPNLKVLISMGGWAERESKDYSAMAESKERRKLFINSVVHFLRKHNFDGLDLHWQFPAESKNGKPADKENFAILLKELKEEFNKNSENWLLTAPLGVLPDTIKNAYNVPEISKHLDYMFALCYAYHGSWEFKTGPNAPLKPMQPGDKLNVESSIITLLRAGAPPSKLVLGVQLYGRNFLLKNEYDGKGFGDPADGNFFGPYVQEAGTYGYNEICHALGEKNSLWKTYWDNVTHTPFMVQNKKFMSYDNERSLTDKLELAREENLAGVSVYALDTDDFQGNCAFEKTGVSNYPLMRLINRALAFGPTKRCEVETFPRGKSRNTEITP